MRKAEDLNIKIPTDEVKCKTCIFSGANPLNIICAKFRIKPSDVLYENAECPKYKELKDGN